MRMFVPSKKSTCNLLWVHKVMILMNICWKLSWVFHKSSGFWVHLIKTNKEVRVVLIRTVVSSLMLSLCTPCAIHMNPRVQTSGYWKNHKQRAAPDGCVSLLQLYTGVSETGSQINSMLCEASHTHTFSCPPESPSRNERRIGKKRTEGILELT
jgi:hypothetical protein